jgi:putative membrane protein
MERQKKVRVTKIQIIVLFLTIAYIIAFGTYYLMAQNYEFLFYVVILVALTAFVSALHLRFNFSTLVLIGASIWGFMHMAGGSFRIAGDRLYGYIILPIASSTSAAGTDIFRFDQFAHFYCYIVVTVMLFYITKPYLKEKVNGFSLSVLLFFMGMGVGALNEFFEFLPVLFLDNTGVGGYYNTLWDIVFNGIGALTAVIYLKLNKKL